MNIEIHAVLKSICTTFQAEVLIILSHHDASKHNFKSLQKLTHFPTKSYGF